MRTLRILMLLGLFSAVPVMAQQPAPEQPIQPAARKLTGEELQKLLPGATLRGVNSEYYFRHTLKADGTLEGGSSRSRKFGVENAFDTGTWQVTGDQLCRQFSKWGSSCAGIERLDDGRYRHVGREHTFTLTQGR